ncbi:helix-hairpin-helix domain-containing protein [Varunaivibrio sulfuroxidans]|uniref:Helix-hairpin-helix protein n=1 Tax=Varunaivibrio sulfuroxidans TaxID=1773489 RepID=A0A4R3J703_9PROT|nr:helix-hairpin-helix domain-containing protein [Varunaivibrio sulfuroxidans]TCS60646.1 helix-hairpin-helix protein [Varunaivibrio sulfuroxidans]WES30135.1 helix-hairpin-helix domain-containing protein [Varunaivibrio sulfuroxidans]
MAGAQLSDISGIGPSAADVLRQGGFLTVEQVAGATVAALTALNGFGPVRASRTIAAAKAVLGGAKDAATLRGDAPSARKKTKSSKKDPKKTKKDKKAKKDDKKKKPAKKSAKKSKKKKSTKK